MKPSIAPVSAVREPVQVEERAAQDAQRLVAQAEAILRDIGAEYVKHQARLDALSKAYAAAQREYEMFVQMLAGCYLHQVPGDFVFSPELGAFIPNTLPDEAAQKE